MPQGLLGPLEGFSASRIARGFKKAAKTPRQKWETAFRACVRAWFKARIVVIPEQQWAQECPAHRPRVYNKDLITNTNPDERRMRDARRGALWEGPG
jgi:hypothetical protein